MLIATSMTTKICPSIGDELVIGKEKKKKKLIMVITRESKK